jgi:hypothetical protein
MTGRIQAGPLPWVFGILIRSCCPHQYSDSFLLSFVLLGPALTMEGANCTLRRSATPNTRWCFLCGFDPVSVDVGRAGLDAPAAAAQQRHSSLALSTLLSLSPWQRATARGARHSCRGAPLPLCRGCVVSYLCTQRRRCALLFSLPIPGSAFRNSPPRASHLNPLAPTPLLSSAFQRLVAYLQRNSNPF